MYSLESEDCKGYGNLRTHTAGIERFILCFHPRWQNQKFFFADLGWRWESRKILLLSDRDCETGKYGNKNSKEIPDTFLNFIFFMVRR
jgi:hypothetical protein